MPVVLPDQHILACEHPENLLFRAFVIMADGDQLDGFVELDDELLLQGLDTGLQPHGNVVGADREGERGVLYQVDFHAVVG